MTESTTLLVAIALPVLGLAVQWGAMRAAARVIDQRLDRIDGSVQRFGERMGALEGDVRVVQSQMARVERHLDGDYSGVVRKP